MTDDPIVAEIRKHREEWAARFNYDIHAIVEDIRSREGTSGHELVYPPVRKHRKPGQSTEKPGLK